MFQVLNLFSYFQLLLVFFFIFFLFFLLKSIYSKVQRATIEPRLFYFDASDSRCRAQHRDFHTRHVLLKSCPLLHSLRMGILSSRIRIREDSLFFCFDPNHGNHVMISLYQSLSLFIVHNGKDRVDAFFGEFCELEKSYCNPLPLLLFRLILRIQY